jgi:hypothetical protein
MGPGHMPLLRFRWLLSVDVSGLNSATVGIFDNILSQLRVLIENVG